MASTSDKIMMDRISVDGSPIPLMCAGKLIHDDSGFLPCLRDQDYMELRT